jgi:hypothetical protein
MNPEYPEYPIFDFLLLSNEPLIKNINRPITYHEILEYENIISNIDDIPNKFIIDNKVYNNIFELLKVEISKLNDSNYKIPIQILVIKNNTILNTEEFYFWKNAEINDEIIDILSSKFTFWRDYLFEHRRFGIYF